MTARSPSWVVAHDSAAAKPMSIHCLRCGAAQEFSMPIAIAVWCAAATAFNRIHKKCKPRETAAVLAGEEPQEGGAT